MPRRTLLCPTQHQIADSQSPALLLQCHFRAAERGLRIVLLQLELLSISIVDASIPIFSDPVHLISLDTASDESVLRLLQLLWDYASSPMIPVPPSFPSSPDGRRDRRLRAAASPQSAGASPPSPLLAQRLLPAVPHLPRLLPPGLARRPSAVAVVRRRASLAVASLPHLFSSSLSSDQRHARARGRR